MSQYIEFSSKLKKFYIKNLYIDDKDSDLETEDKQFDWSGEIDESFSYQDLKIHLFSILQ